MNRTKVGLAIVLAIIVLPTPAGAVEVCGDGIDNDSNGLADEGCYPALTTGVCESPLSCEQTGMVSPKTGSLRYSLPPDVSPSCPTVPR